MKKQNTAPEEEKKSEKFVTVGIPAYKAEDHIADALSSIRIQTISDAVAVVIAKDNPSDNYDFLKTQFPDLDITIVECEKNTGPGLARQRALEACKTPWITFMDADDVLINPLSLEYLVKEIKPDTIEVQGAFMQEIQGHPQGVRLMERNDVGHPWVFGRLYCVPFLKQMGIGFSELRAMED